MIAAVGMGAYVAGMFHLITHAFFKGLLFMGSGSIIHGMEHGHHHLHNHHDDGFDPQDMRFMGNLHKHMPITSWTFHIGALALAGIVPLAGFWSKDEILAHADANGFTAIYWILALAAICTAFYMGRQLKMVFHGKERHEAAKHAHESPLTMTAPLIILAVLSIVGGFVINLPFLSASANEANHGHAGGAYLRLEGWLEHSIASFALSEGGEEGHSETADDSHADEAEHAEAEDSHATEESADTHAEEESHAEETADSHGEEDAHGAEESDDHAVASIVDTYGGRGLLHLPHTPVDLSYTVAGLSTLFAVIALAASFFGVYGKKPQTADEKDPLQAIPGWGFFAALPFNYLGMNILVPAFNRFANFAGITVDWDFYHDYFHNNIIRDGFVGISRLTSEVLDLGIVDGLLVNGTAKLVGMLSGGLRRFQTGFVRNYALGVFVGVVALLAYFVLVN
jgi:NADH:ubiquinone oxidoreductase subunit 5 (subunit L)/multisubunit Na+/H+ antiporter MnhA subunit